jgi:SAM-dependent methyltransferase
MRPILLNYFGLAPGMEVLEVGCGPDTMASYLAEGINPGHVIGLDLDEEFIHRARTKAEEKSVSNVSFVVGDAYQLPFKNEAFDAVISYTGMGILSTPEVAVKEMLRVCRSRGTMSIAEAVTGRFGINFPGIDSITDEEPFPGAKRYYEVIERIQHAASIAPISGVGSKSWPPQAMLALLGKLGITKIRFNAWGYGLAPDDERVNAERQQFRQTWYRLQREWLEGLGDSYQPNISHEELTEAINLADAHFNWLTKNAAYDWEAGVSVIASGIKET